MNDDLFEEGVCYSRLFVFPYFNLWQLCPKSILLLSGEKRWFSKLDIVSSKSSDAKSIFILYRDKDCKKTKNNMSVLKRHFKEYARHKCTSLKKKNTFDIV